MSNYVMYVRIDGEPFLSRVKQYRKEWEACAKAWRAFAKKRGATSVPGGLSGLNFEHGDVPKGWKKPSGKYGWSRPHKGHPDEAIMKSLPKKPSSYDVFGDSIIDMLNWEGPGCSSGSGCIGFFFEGPSIGWAGDVFFATIPDAKKAADDHLAKYPKHKITSGADAWVLPEGLTRLSEAEYNLIIAQYQVQLEKKGASK